MSEDNEGRRGSCSGVARRAGGAIKGVGDQDGRIRGHEKREERKEVRERFPAPIIERDQIQRSLMDGVATSSGALSSWGALTQLR